MAVKSAKAFISDEAEPAPHLTSTDMAGLPVYVSGTLTVTISETSPEAFNAIRSGKLSIWSNSEKSGDYKTVDNPGTYTFNGLVPAAIIYSSSQDCTTRLLLYWKTLRCKEEETQQSL